jgi:hypothetical protein
LTTFVQGHEIKVDPKNGQCIAVLIEIPLVENPEYPFSDPDDFPDKLTMGDKFTDPNTITEIPSPEESPAIRCTNYLWMTAIIFFIRLTNLSSIC